MIPSPDAISGAAALLGVPAERLALVLPLVLAMGGNAAHDELVALSELEKKIEKAGLRAKVKSGELPIVRIGRADYVRRSDVLALVAPRVSVPPAKTSVDLSDLAARERATKKRRAA